MSALSDESTLTGSALPLVVFISPASANGAATLVVKLVSHVLELDAATEVPSNIIDISVATPNNFTTVPDENGRAPVAAGPVNECCCEDLHGVLIRSQPPHQTPAGELRRSSKHFCKPVKGATPLLPKNIISK